MTPEEALLWQIFGDPAEIETQEFRDELLAAGLTYDVDSDSYIRKVEE